MLHLPQQSCLAQKVNNSKVEERRPKSAAREG
jgi:hypothetical protein